MKKFTHAALPLLAAVAAGSMAHAAIPKGATVSAVNAAEPVEFEVFLPLQNDAQLESLLEAQQTPGNAQYHKWLTPSQFAKHFGPDQATIDSVRQTLQAQGLQVTAVHTQSLHVVGDAAKVNAAFSTKLNNVATADGKHTVMAEGALRLPLALQTAGAVIPAFTGIPEHKVHSKKLTQIAPDNRNGPYGSYNYNDLKQAYDYPSYQSMLPGGQRLDGTGVKVAVLMSNTALQSDVQAMFDHEGFTTTTGMPAPTFDVKKVDGGGPFGSGGDFEASLDVQQVLGGAPGSAVTLVSIPNLSDAHILDGYVTIVDENKWDLVNSSFGGCELNYTKSYNSGTDYTGILRVYHDVFKQGNAQGITFVASSGDSGGLSCPEASYFYGNPNPHFVPSVQTPSDDPNVTAVGGGNLGTTPPPNPQTDPIDLTSKYVTENSYGDPEVPYDIYGVGTNVSGGYWGAGGGVSVIFQTPKYQQGLFGKGVGRQIPDIGMQVGGCPGGLTAGDCPNNRSAAIVTYAGGRYGVIGTSVSSPELVGALALYVQKQGGRVGNVNKFLYARALVQDDFGADQANKVVQYYHKKIPGFDGVYRHTSAVYDYMIGNGTPDVRRLFDMTEFDAASTPRTPSNP